MTDPHPHPVAFTTHEGGPHFPWIERDRVRRALIGSRNFNAVWFSNGAVFDDIGGWRPNVLNAEQVATVLHHAQENLDKLRSFGFLGLP